MDLFGLLRQGVPLELLGRWHPNTTDALAGSGALVDAHNRSLRFVSRLVGCLSFCLVLACASGVFWLYRFLSQRYESSHPWYGLVFIGVMVTLFFTAFTLNGLFTTYVDVDKGRDLALSEKLIELNRVLGGHEYSSLITREIEQTKGYCFERLVVLALEVLKREHESGVDPESLAANRVFEQSHKIMREFLLVDEKWDRYFTEAKARFQKKLAEAGVTHFSTTDEIGDTLVD